MSQHTQQAAAPFVSEEVILILAELQRAKLHATDRSWISGNPVAAATNPPSPPPLPQPSSPRAAAGGTKKRSIEEISATPPSAPHVPVVGVILPLGTPNIQAQLPIRAGSSLIAHAALQQRIQLPPIVPSAMAAVPPSPSPPAAVKSSEPDDSSSGNCAYGRDVQFKRQWEEKYEELCAYRKRVGHCHLPHSYKDNMPLARWVKRQRYQFKLMQEGKHSTLNPERVRRLDDIGFVWDSQGAAWVERLGDLYEFKSRFSHCNVPCNYNDNKQLATWVKCQRRQYKLYKQGKPSNIDEKRISELEELGFTWELRSHKKARTDSSA